MKLSSGFYEKLNKVMSEELVDEQTRSILTGVDWNTEAARCYNDLINFFDSVDNNAFNKRGIGVVDIRWNEYGGDIEVDFMPDNNLETAFDQGCIMNSSAIDNDEFFNNTFNCDGDKSFQVLGDDYTAIIQIYNLILVEIMPSVVKSIAFQRLPMMKPSYITFAFFHDEQPEVILKLTN